MKFILLMMSILSLCNNTFSQGINLCNNEKKDCPNIFTDEIFNHVKKKLLLNNFSHLKRDTLIDIAPFQYDYNFIMDSILKISKVNANYYQYYLHIPYNCFYKNCKNGCYSNYDVTDLNYLIITVVFCPDSMNRSPIITSPSLIEDDIIDAWKLNPSIDEDLLKYLEVKYLSMYKNFRIIETSKKIVKIIVDENKQFIINRKDLVKFDFGI